MDKESKQLAGTTSPASAAPKAKVAEDLTSSLRIFVDSVRDYAIFLLDPNGIVQTWNPSAQRIQGYSPDEIIGQSFASFYPPEDVAAGKPARELEIAIREGKYEEEGWRVRKDGSRLWASVVLTALRNENGELIGFGKVTRDMSASRETNEALRQSEERLRLMVESVKDYAIFMLDPQGCVLSWNAGAERLKGYRPEEIIGRHFSAFYSDDDVKSGKCERELEAAIQDGRVEDEGWRIRKDGTRFWASVVITAVRDEGGRLRGFAKVTRDLTDRMHSEETRLRLAQSDEAVRLRNEFLSVASHELRTPLTPLSMHLQSIERSLQRGDVLDPKLPIKARRQVQRLTRLIDDLLDFSRIQQGQLELDQETFSLAPLLREVIEDFQEAGNYRITLDAGTPADVFADRGRLEQVIINLLQNAIKYSPAGGAIAVSLQTVGSDVRVTVADQGIGVPAEDLDQLFQRFFRARNATARNYGGMGLGLYLSNEIVRRHGGRFEVQSQPDRGSSFSFILPAQAAIAPREPAPNRRILVVDDERGILEALSDFLIGEGYSVEVARDGSEALQVLRRRKPDLVIIDLMMPVLDGAGLIERMRSESLAERLPIVVFSADRQVYARATTLRADAALRKPIDLEELIGVVRRLSPNSAIACA